MQGFRSTAAAMTAVVLLAGCASTPMGPRVAVMPGPGKSFDAFAQDQEMCKGYATQQVSGQAESANERAIGTAAIGTVLGAGLGAALGGGRGAAIGAGGGAAIGTGVGASNSQKGEGGIQGQYDNAYVQCMTAKGNTPPRPAPVVYAPPPTVIYQAPPPVVYAPPPPPGYYAPPPPPPGYYAPPPTVVYPQ